jgi:hypothetical protein
VVLPGLECFTNRVADVTYVLGQRVGREKPSGDVGAEPKTLEAGTDRYRPRSGTDDRARKLLRRYEGVSRNNVVDGRGSRRVKTMSERRN